MSKIWDQIPEKVFSPLYPSISDMSQKYAHHLPRVYAIFWLSIEYSAKAEPPQHTTIGARAPGVAPLLLCAEEVEPWLNTQWITKRLHILLAEDGHIFLRCLQLVGTLGKHIIFGPRFFDMSSASGYVGETYFQESGPRFLDMSPTRMVRFEENKKGNWSQISCVNKKGARGGGPGPLHGRVKSLYLGTATKRHPKCEVSSHGKL